MALLMLLAGCSAARVDSFRQFATAGRAYVQAIDALAGEAGALAVDADSAVLGRGREGLDKRERAETVIEHDELLRERILLLDDLRMHARLLDAYFASLAALAESGAPPQIGRAAADLVDALQDVGGRLEGARVGELPVDRFTGSLVEISVAGFRQAALEQELRARGLELRRELDIQRAAVEAITETMKTDFEIVLARREQVDVVEPYQQGGRLARIWTERRRELLTATAAIGALDAAARAAAALQKSFDALLRDELGAAEIASLLADVNQILTLIEAVRGLQSASEPGA